MVPDRKHLASQIDDLRKRVEDSRYLLSMEQTASYVVSLESIAQRLSAAAEPVLHIGLLGGTGVGKSTLINALAEEPVSSVSDRRPHTDRVVVYRHEETALPSGMPSHLLKEPHQTHRNERIHDLIIYDFPDFDSILTRHREQVSAFLVHLDLIVWVTSPEKYADLRLYEVLRDCEKHQENFIFVINKLDKLSPDNGNSNHEAARLIGDFSLKLKDAGIHAPRMYHFAAREVQTAQSPSHPRDDFIKFREALFRQRDKKEILAIKAANVEVEVEGVRKALHALGLRLAHVRPEVESLVQSVRDRLPALRKRCSSSLEQLFTPRTSAVLWKSMISYQEDVAPVSLLRSIWKHPSTALPMAEDRDGWESPLEPDDDRLTSLRDEVAIPLSSLSTLLHRSGLPRAAEELKHVEDDLQTDLKSILAEGAEMFSRIVRRTSLPWERWTGWMRRAGQRLWLAIPAVLLLVALAGPENVQAFSLNPDLRGALRLILNVVLSPFKPEGLVSLLTFVVLETLVSMWLASRALRSVARRAKKARDRFNDELVQVARQRMESRVKKLEDMGRRLVEEIGRLAGEGAPDGPE